MEEKFIQLRRICDEMAREPLSSRRSDMYLKIAKLSREIQFSIKNDYTLKEGA
jgi:hypothetical protein